MLYDAKNALITTPIKFRSSKNSLYEKMHSKMHSWIYVYIFPDIITLYLTIFTHDIKHIKDAYMKYTFTLGSIHDIAYFHRPGRPNLRNARRAYLCTLSAVLQGDALTFRAARVENGNWHGFRIKGASLPPKRTLLPSFKGTTRFFSEKL